MSAREANPLMSEKAMRRILGLQSDTTFWRARPGLVRLGVRFVQKYPGSRERLVVRESFYSYLRAAESATMAAFKPKMPTNYKHREVA